MVKAPRGFVVKLEKGSLPPPPGADDGARDAQPTAQHLYVANLPGVKLRLGRLVRGASSASTTWRSCPPNSFRSCVEIDRGSPRSSIARFLSQPARSDIAILKTRNAQRFDAGSGRRVERRWIRFWMTEASA
jgi:hypothetical protein